MGTVRFGGVTMASVYGFRITVTGKGGHGSTPENCVDPIVAAIKIREALETLMSREKSPFAEAVLTIGKFQAGDAANVIPEQAVMEGMLRALQRGLPAPSRHHLRRQRSELASKPQSIIAPPRVWACRSREGGASVAPPARLLRYTGSTALREPIYRRRARNARPKVRSRKPRSRRRGDEESSCFMGRVALLRT